MTQFQPLVPPKAIVVVEGAGIPHAQRLIRDHAAAGLVKSYAMLVETIEVSGRITCVRGAAMPIDLWRRIVAECADEDLWTGGTVRLAPGELVGGLPAVNITGIGFNGSDLQRLVDQHRGVSSKRRARAEVTALPLQPSEGEPVATLAAASHRKAPDLSPLHSGALLLTVRQVEAALAKGRTSIYKMISQGKLERPDGETRITAESVRRCAGLVD